MITIKKITSLDLLREACESTFNGESKQTLFQQYRSEESPARTQIFWITLDPIPVFVATHLVRHHVGSQPFALTHRIDRKGGGEDAGRSTPSKLSLLINAQSLIDMAKQRLCLGASHETREAMEDVKAGLWKVDPDLTMFLQPKCIYRNGLCEKLKCRYYLSPAGSQELDKYRRLFK